MPKQKEYVMDVLLKMLTRDYKPVEMRIAPRAQVEVSGPGRVPQEFLDHLMRSVGFRHADRVKVTGL